MDQNRPRTAAGEAPEEGMACGVQGCLIGAMLFFATLLIVMLYITLTREIPQP